MDFPQSTMTFPHMMWRVEPLKVNGELTMVVLQIGSRRPWPDDPMTHWWGIQGTNRSSRFLGMRRSLQFPGSACPTCRRMWNTRSLVFSLQWSTNVPGCNSRALLLLHTSFCNFSVWLIVHLLEQVQRQHHLPAKKIPLRWALQRCTRREQVLVDKEVISDELFQYKSWWS